MERRRAVAIAAAVATTTVGAIAAITVNFGLLGSNAAGSTPAGSLDAGRVADVVDPAAGAVVTPNLSPDVTAGNEDDAGQSPAQSPREHEEGDDAGHETEHRSGHEAEQEAGHDADDD